MVDETPGLSGGGAPPRQPAPSQPSRSGWLRGRLDALRVVLDRAGLLILFVVLSAFGLSQDQGQDVLRAMTEGGADWYAEPVLLYFVGGLCLLAFNLWFWSRLLLGVRIREGEPYPGELWMRRHLPRGFAGAALVLPGLAALQEGGERAPLLGAALCALGIAAAALLAPDRRLFGLRPFAVRPWAGFGSLVRGSEAQRMQTAVFAFSLALLVGGILVFAFGPATFGMRLGMAAVLAVWAASMVPVAALLDLISDAKRVPILVPLIGVAVVFSLWNDNHDIRRTAGVQVEGQPDVESQFRRWLSAREAERAAAGLSGPVPMVLVASEGGGIRSAYWTAAILAELQDRDPDFARHVFAVSGVSGGSMGAAVFAALIANITPAGGDADDASVCPRLRPAAAGETAAEPHAGPMRLMARDLLGRDYLSPILGGLLYPDLLQWLLPVPVTAFDRARTFEEAWEEVWDETCGLDPATAQERRATNPLAAPLQDLWHGERRTVVPSMLFNTTRVGTGQRAVASNLNVFQRNESFVTVLPLMTLIGIQETPERRESLPTITAASLSARFPVVSPVGAIQLKLSPVPEASTAPVEYLRFADGGYYENSGAATLRDILAVVESAGRDRVRPIVVQISNDPDALWPPRWQRTPEQARLAATLEEEDPAPIAGEILSPLLTLLNTRSARGVEELESLKSRIAARFPTATDAEAAEAAGEGALHLHFKLCQSEGQEPPLGWYLSEDTQDLIDRHLADPETCAAFGVDNVAELGRLARAVASGAE